ncbi:hypothetical protein ABZ572_36580 [Streptomyces sp. NPDC018338]|uniref:hypothetical protein n=1 Tax=Streptomyces sp. NPDC018338 TaxID=3157192 RepID=UPI0033CAB26C
MCHALAEAVDHDASTAAAPWRGAVLRLATRMATTDALPPYSPWLRPPYDAHVDDPVAWAARTPPPETRREHLAELLRVLSEHQDHPGHRAVTQGEPR